MTERFRVGVVGARGHTGSELLRILNAHHDTSVVYAGSRGKAGEGVPEVGGLTFEAPDEARVAAANLDAVFLALPNGVGGTYAAAISGDSVIVDISADNRFADDWAYGLPELFRDKIAGARRIANPGCYATTMQLSIAPFVDLLSGVPAVFGVSGFSGAGTTPGPLNDQARLRDNLIPYRLVGHIHEREASKHLGHQVRFMPHVHPTFRGLITTAHIPVSRRFDAEEARELLEEAYSAEPLIELQDDPPELNDGKGRTGVVIGGIDVSDDGHNVVVVAAEDNLLKGAAVQAVQNMNLALGLPELTGLA